MSGKVERSEAPFLPLARPRALFLLFSFLFSPAIIAIKISILQTQNRQIPRLSQTNSPSNLSDKVNILSEQINMMLYRIVIEFKQTNSPSIQTNSPLKIRILTHAETCLNSDNIDNLSELDKTEKKQPGEVR